MSNGQNSAQQADLADTALRLRLAVTRTARVLRREAGGRLTPTALSALAAIERRGPLTPARLADIESVKPPTVTRIASHLVDQGMIERSQDLQDGRSVLLEVSEAGREYLEERRQAKSAYLADLLSTLPAADVSTLSRAADILEELNDRRFNERHGGDRAEIAPVAADSGNTGDPSDSGTP
jgi:DNA-binding MarR family transcriptional regulator